MQFNNPASRLYAILSELKVVNANQATSVVLANCLGVEQRPKDLMHAIVQFHGLVKEVAEYAAKTNLPTGPLSRYIPQIESAVGFTNLDAPWAAYKDRITPECLVTLEMIAQIDNVEQDKEIPVEELMSLEKSIQELFDEVDSKEELDKEFKFFVLTQIEKIRRAISEYRISGASGFSHYIESLIIDVTKQSKTIKKADKTKVMDKFKKIVKTVSVFASFTSSSLLAIENIAGAFEVGSGLLTELRGETEMLEDHSSSTEAIKV